MLWVLLTVVAFVAALFAFAYGSFGGGAYRARGIAWIFLLSIGWMLFTGYSSLRFVQQGEIMVAKSFGATVENEWAEGPHFLPPWYSTHTYNIQRRQIDMVDGNTVSGAARGGVALEQFDVSLPFELRPGLVWKIAREIGVRYDSMLVAAARSAARDTLAQFAWEEIAFGERAAVTEYLTNRFREVLVTDLENAGFTTEEARTVFTIYPAQIREVRPPQRILQENAELAAAEVALARQEVLTRIAEQEALRRRNEGSGISNLWDELPDASAEEIAVVLGAIANKTRADAMMRAVEDGEVRVIVLNGSEAAIPIE